MLILALKGAHTTKVQSGDLTPDDLEHLTEDQINEAIDDERYWKALHSEGEASAYVVPFGQGAYCVSVDLAGNIRSVLYDPDLESLKHQFERALEAEEETTTVTEGHG